MAVGGISQGWGGGLSLPAELLWEGDVGAVRGAAPGSADPLRVGLSSRAVQAPGCRVGTLQPRDREAGITGCCPASDARALCGPGGLAHLLCALISLAVIVSGRGLASLSAGFSGPLARVEAGARAPGQGRAP